MKKLKIVADNYGNKVAILPDIIFSNKQNIDWNEVECYLQRYVGELIEVIETKDKIYIGNKFPDEYSSSKYTRKMRGARAKAKANAAQGIREMVEIATQKTFRPNYKEKHCGDAQNGWYYYITRFAIPIYDNEKNTGEYNVYSASLVVNRTSANRMYLYDIVNIKKEASNPLKTNAE
nr:hypothetical protein [uncultured Blautia sp.]